MDPPDQGGGTGSTAPEVAETTAQGLLSGPETAGFGTYNGLIPAAGDSHVHTVNPDGLANQARATNSTQLCSGTHESALSVALFDAAKNGGYDWLNISPHAIASQGDGTNNFPLSPTESGYRYWINPASKLPPPTIGVLPLLSPLGYPNYATGGAVFPPFNWALSLSSAATARTTSTFVAIVGREYTVGTCVQANNCAGDSFCQRPDGTCDIGRPQGGGHKIVLLPGAAATAAGPVLGTLADEADLYQWVTRQKGVIIQAHPGGIDVVPLDAAHRGGFSDRFVQGIEYSSGKARLNDGVVLSFAGLYHQFLAKGFRLFPAVGSDEHHTPDPCPNTAYRNRQAVSDGATVCWVPRLTSSDLTDSMRQRRCYFAAAFRPELKFELSDNASGAGAVPMGGVVDSTDGQLAVRVFATGDPRQAQLGITYDVLELVRSTSANTNQVVRSCTRGSTDANCTCNKDPATGLEKCTLRADALALGDGPYHVRVRCLNGSQVCRGAVLTSAPIFVNMTRYRSSIGFSDGSCDFDGDGVDCDVDTCNYKSNPGVAQLDSDGDGHGDVCDVCPNAPDPLQLDTDGDGVGDACNSDLDRDGDEIRDDRDVCQGLFDPNQYDLTRDGRGDACNDAIDPDGDEVENDRDVCPDKPSPPDAKDTDFDGIGDLCNSVADGLPAGDPRAVDQDGDEFAEPRDNCRGTNNPDQNDSNADGRGDACSTPGDVDGDGIPASGFATVCGNGQRTGCNDNCPFAFNPDQLDRGGIGTTVADGVGDACQCLDGNGDGVVRAVTATDVSDLKAFIPLTPVLGGPSAACGQNPALCARCATLDFPSACNAALLEILKDPARLAAMNPRACAANSPHRAPDSDGDHFPDKLDDCPFASNPSQGGSCADRDGDGLLILTETTLGLDPNRADTDGNGIADGAEDPDIDGLDNLTEIALFTDPRVANATIAVTGPVALPPRKMRFPANLVVQQGASLFVASGAELLFKPGNGLDVAGMLFVVPVFASPLLPPDPTRFASTNVGPGSWRGISLLNGSPSHTINNAEIVGAETGIRIGNTTATVTMSRILGSSGSGVVFVGAATGEVSDSTVDGAGISGIRMEDLTRAVTVQRNRIRNVALEGIFLRGGPATVLQNDVSACDSGFVTHRIGIAEVHKNRFVGNKIGVIVGRRDPPAVNLPVITNNEIRDNRELNLTVDRRYNGGSTLTIDATNNFWGFTNTAQIDATIDDTIVPGLPRVRFEPFLTAPPAP